MSQAPGAAAGGPAGAGLRRRAGDHALARAERQADGRRRDTPKLLNRWQVLAVAACLLFGVAPALQFLRWQANGRAADNTEQLVRVQKIQSLAAPRGRARHQLASWSAASSHPSSAAEYDDAINLRAPRRSPMRLTRSPPTARCWPRSTRVVTDYTTAVTQARDNNRQGFPVGSAYLTRRQQPLRGDASRSLDALTDANTDARPGRDGEPAPAAGCSLFGAAGARGPGLVNRARQAFPPPLQRRPAARPSSSSGRPSSPRSPPRSTTGQRRPARRQLRTRSTRPLRAPPPTRQGAREPAADRAGLPASYEEPLWQDRAAVVDDRTTSYALGPWDAYTRRTRSRRARRRRQLGRQASRSPRRSSRRTHRRPRRVRRGVRRTSCRASGHDDHRRAPVRDSSSPGAAAADPARRPGRRRPRHWGIAPAP